MGYLATLAICNVPESSLVRESELVFMTRAGREIGVASTKAFTTQLLALLMLTMVLAQDNLVEEERIKLAKLIKHVPKAVSDALKLNREIKHLADYFADKENALFLGRGTQWKTKMASIIFFMSHMTVKMPRLPMQRRMIKVIPRENHLEGSA